MINGQLSIGEEKEAIALYRHLLEHKEVQSSPINPNMPMCKICNRTAKDILENDYS